MAQRFSVTSKFTLFWLVLIAAALYGRPLLPVDETRYLAVAWDMWLRGDFLVPHLNGEPYSHKPPLLFWLMQAGWALFGVNEWWPRLIAPLFGLGCLFLTRALALALWPGDRRIADLAPLLLSGCLFWALFVTVTMFDMILAFFALLGLLGVIRMQRDGGWSGGVLIALAVGLGVLTKGPAILLHILPVALTAPLWARRLSEPGSPAGPGAGAWYLRLLAAVVAGVGLALAWAVPAGIAGGSDYQQAIFWGQAAGRMVESFAHQRPFWWYASLLPLLVLPWFVWPPLWRAFRRMGVSLWREGGQMFCLIWAVTAFFVFSLISGKQLHYLLPEFPALALIAARALTRSEASFVSLRRGQFIAAALFAVLGLVLVALPLAGGLPLRLPLWAPDVGGFWGVLTVLAAAFAGLYRAGRLQSRVMSLVLLPVSLVVALHLALAPVLAQRYDMEPIARQLKTFEEAGHPLANFGKYHGQFHFPGRLQKPLAVIGLRVGDVEAYLRDHPDSRVVAYYKTLPQRAQPVAVFPFRQGVMAIWEARTMIDHPGIGNRR